MIWPTFDSLNVHATRLLEPLEDDSLDKASNFHSPGHRTSSEEDL